ncbi:vWA domain-containing protein [Microvirga antarctica]|uniref:vWA domain-containing protein n=1 Tax=Microvirga antarctica TaxID=2819233 RepID=UPI001B30A967|nr:vWA domain-containing protein [Microvirga antarctica]
MDTYILLDRSGSMTAKWPETLAAIDGYVRELAHATPQTRVTLALFDDPTDGASSRPGGCRDPSWFHIARTGQRADRWRPLSKIKAKPRGITPLFDAIARIVKLVEERAAPRSVLVIVTDGEENASQTVTAAAAKAHLDRCRERGWQVIFLGADFSNFEQASQLGAQPGQALTMVSGSYSLSLGLLAQSTVSYNATGSQVQLLPETPMSASTAKLSSTLP